MIGSSAVEQSGPSMGMGSAAKQKNQFQINFTSFIFNKSDRLAGLKDIGCKL
jgi:hypothetical protein